jgi:hypothetical protein
VTTLAGIASVLLVAVGIFYTNDANRSQQALAERGQVTERFTRAIDQLGSDKVEVRLGAIYGLERLMLDAPKDQRNIIEVLSAYVRRRPLTPTRSAATVEPTTPGSPSTGLDTDVQAALAILGRLSSSADRTTVDLRDARLVEADLTMMNFSGADLSGATLTNARVTNADLSGANLTFAKLSGADLSGTRLNQSVLDNTDFSYAVFDDAILAGARLYYANLAGAQLRFAKGITSDQIRCSYVDLETSYPHGVAPSRLDLTYVTSETLQTYLDPTCPYPAETNGMLEPFSLPSPS